MEDAIIEKHINVEIIRASEDLPYNIWNKIQLNILICDKNYCAYYIIM